MRSKILLLGNTYLNLGNTIEYTCRSINLGLSFSLIHIVWPPGGGVVGIFFNLNLASYFAINVDYASNLWYDNFCWLGMLKIISHGYFNMAGMKRL